MERKWSMKIKQSGIRQIGNSFLAIIFLGGILYIGIKVMPGQMIAIKNAVETNTFTSEFVENIETQLNENFPEKASFVDINGIAHRILLQREMNDVVLLNNGQEYMLAENRSNAEIIANVDSLEKLDEWLENRNIKFLYCQEPIKLGEADEQLPKGLIDNANHVADIFVNELNERTINNIDIRECIETDGIDRYSLFLSTEHHWKPEGGFYAFQKICDYLREQFGEDIPDYITDINNYNVDYMGKSLGYYGQRTGIYFGGTDDFNLIYPKWETKQSSWAPHMNLLREGNFYDAIFLMDYLQNADGHTGLYRTYIGGDWPVVVHASETAPIEKTVMVLIDSYGTITESFLTTVYKRVIALDLRWVLRNNIGKTTVEFVEDYNPDLVIVMFNPSQLGYAESEQFQYGIPDE